MDLKAILAEGALRPRCVYTLTKLQKDEREGAGKHIIKVA